MVILSFLKGIKTPDDDADQKSLENLRKRRGNGDTDFCLIVATKDSLSPIRCHKRLLEMNCDAFGNMSKNGATELNLDGYSVRAVRTMIEFLYYGRIPPVLHHQFEPWTPFDPALGTYLHTSGGE